MSVLSDDDRSTASGRPKAGFFRRVFLGYEDAPDTAATASDAEATAAEEAPRSTDDAVALAEAPPSVEPFHAFEDTPLHHPASPEPTRPPIESGDAGTLERLDDALHPASIALAPEPPALPDAPTPAATKRSWWSRLREGLARSSSSIGTGIADIFTKRKLDAAMLEDLEDVLIRADLGVATATRISEAVGRGRYDRDVSPDDVKAILAEEVERVLSPYAKPLHIAPHDGAAPFVILVVGVNGSGKTTTIGKLAAKFTSEGKVVALAAGDTFRAAAIAQLRIWGERFGCQVIAREQGSDAAGLAYEAIETARASRADVLLMDTAGRLQNRAELMAELTKIIKVMRKLDARAPHAVLLVLDATVGQNALSASRNTAWAPNRFQNHHGTLIWIERPF